MPGFRTGGYLKEIPKPHYRKYHLNGRRPVYVRINSWMGISPGAKHWYAKISETHNPIYNWDDDCWQDARDDEEGKGREFQDEFVNFGCSPNIKYAKDQAIEWAKKILEEHFEWANEDLYEFRWEIQGDMSWIYTTNGD